MAKGNTRKTKPAPRLLRGGALRTFVAKAKQAIADSDADPEHQRIATEKLDFVVKDMGLWEINRPDFPGLPNLPRFHPRPERGKSYSNIPVPREHRHLFKNRKQRTKCWQGSGMAAWCYYLAAVKDEVAYYANPPEATRSPAPPDKLDDELDTLDQLKGRNDADIRMMANLLFHSEVVTGMMSRRAKDVMIAEWQLAVAYLKRKGRIRIDQIDHNTLSGFRNVCAKWLRDGKRARTTVNGYLRTFRRVLKWCAAFCEVQVPAYDVLLRNFTGKDLVSFAKSAGQEAGARQFGRADIIPMPVAVMGAWLAAARRDPFHLALTMCSLNLAAGAADLSDLPLEDRTLTNPLPCVDMERRLFITHRSKTFNRRWTLRTEEGEPAIRMMDRTHEALAAWFDRREELLHELKERRATANRIQRAAKARRLRAKGLSKARIAAELGVAVGNVHDILRQPADRREWARSLAEKGHSQKDIVALTGLGTGTVSKYVRDITARKPPKPRGNRYSIITPDPNRVFFVPSTGRPLVNHSSKHNYVITVFNRICKEAGIIREVDILAGRQAPPEQGTFILPKRNGHYIFRRTAATVAGMLGGVPERALQGFLGHDSPEMTRKYVLDPPSSYRGDRIEHGYRIKLKHSDDPIAVLEEFLDVSQESASS